MFQVISEKLRKMFEFASFLRDFKPEMRKPAHEILSLSEYWLITPNDIISDYSITRIFNEWLPHKNSKSKLLYVNILHAFYRKNLFQDYYGSRRLMENITENYPKFDKLSSEIKSCIKSTYIYREMVDKLFLITIEDQVFEVTFSQNIGQITEIPERLDELCNVGVCSITCGERHVIARTQSGLLYSWGDNLCGQLGDDSNVDRYKPMIIDSLSTLNIIEVCCGAYHSLALTNEGELFAWGYNRIGQIGNGQNKNNEWAPININPSSAGKFKMISCGYHHSMAISSNGIVYGWGYNGYGQLGIGHYHDHVIPQVVMNLNDISISKIVCGRYHSLFLSCEGDIYGCGKNSCGQIGSNKLPNLIYPTKMNDSEKFTDISATIFDNTSFARSESNSFYICGECRDEEKRNLTKTEFRSFHEMQMAVTYSGRSNQPVYNGKRQEFFESNESNSSSNDRLNINILQNHIGSQIYFFSIYSYTETKSLIISDKNEIWCLNLRNNLNNSYRIEKVLEFSENSIIQISSGAAHLLALTSSGKIYSWGYNNSKQLGHNPPIGFYKPTLIPSIENFKKISCGAYHSLALSELGQVYSWGHNYHGQIGNNKTSDEITLYKVELSTKRIIDISTGYNHSIAITCKGDVFSWGNNEFGQLGIGTNFVAYKPNQVIFPQNTIIIRAVCGKNHSLFLSESGHVYAAGLNHFGQIGNKTEINQNTPVKVMSSINFVDISATIFDHISVARSEDGYCYMWGECSGVSKVMPEKTKFRSMNEVYSIYSESKQAYKLISFKFND